MHDPRARASTRLLLGGIPVGIGQWLSESLEPLQAVTVCSGPETLDRLQNERWDLAILDESLGMGCLRQVAALDSRPEIWISLTCIDNPAQIDEIWRDLGAGKLLLHPLEPEQMLSDLVVTLGLKRTQASSPDDFLSSIWKSNQADILAQVVEVENAVAGLVTQTLNQETRLAGQRNAHKLAGSLGTFEIPQGSRLASSLETLLIQSGRELPTPEVILKAADEVSELRKVVLGARPTGPCQFDKSDGPAPLRVLLLGPFGEELLSQGRERNLALLPVRSIQEARLGLLQGARAAALYLANADGLELFSEISRDYPSVPVVAVISPRSGIDCVEAVRLGAASVMEEPFDSGHLLDELEGVLASRMRPPTVLAVDDDPEVLASLTEMLSGHLALHTLADPLAFWEALHRVEPDLLILDVDMPGLSGIELCRALRHSARWRQLPLIFLSQSQEPELISRLFKSGADDYVSKPIVWPELTGRIFNRLERVRSQQRASTIDPLTRLDLGNNAAAEMNRLLDLARRSREPFCLALVSLEEALEKTALAQCGQSLLRFMRSYDHVSRWSSREFLVGMFNIDRLTAARRMQVLVAQLAEGPAHPVALVGIAELNVDGQSLEDLVGAARRAARIAAGVGGPQVATTERAFPPLVGPTPRPRLVDVLLVEDDVVLAPLVLHALKNRNYSCTWIDDGAQALEALLTRLWRPRLILLDIDLPGISGLRLLRRLKEERMLGGVQVIMLTVRASESEVLEALESGASHHVAKPFSLPLLMERVQHALA